MSPGSCGQWRRCSSAAGAPPGNVARTPPCRQREEEHHAEVIAPEVPSDVRRRYVRKSTFAHATATTVPASSRSELSKTNRAALEPIRIIRDHSALGQAKPACKAP